MADLIDRISGQAIDRPKINLHRFMAAERLYALGEWAGAEIAAEFDIQGDELIQAEQLRAQIDGILKIADKAIYVMRAESVMMCIEDGDDGFYHNLDGTINKTKVAEDLLIAS